MKKIIHLSLILLAVAYGFVAVAQAREAFVLKDPILEKDGYKYAITGVGDSKDDPRWNDFPVRFEFATVRNELYSDIDVKIMTPAGKKVFKVKVNAPWFLIDLKPGTYQVFATDKKGVKKSVTAVIPATGQARYTLKW